MSKMAMERHAVRTTLAIFSLLALLPMLAAKADTRPPGTRLIASQPGGAEVSVALGQQLIRAMYQNCGLEVEFLEAPSARALSLAETGWTDGELARIPSVVSPHSDLVPLQPPLVQLKLVPIFLDPKISRTNSLDAAQRIGYINGYRMAPPVIPDGKIAVPARDSEQLILLLERGRIDVALVLDWDAQQAAEDYNRIIIGEPVLESPVHHYINRNRLADAPCLSQALQELQNAGFVERLISKIPRQAPQTASDDRQP